MKKRITLDIPQDLLWKIDQQAARDERSRNWLIIKTLDSAMGKKFPQQVEASTTNQVGAEKKAHRHPTVYRMGRPYCVTCGAFV